MNAPETPGDAFSDVLNEALAPPVISQPTETRIVKQHTPEFKSAAVARVKNGEQPAQVAKDVGIHNSLIYKWVQNAKEGKPLQSRKQGIAAAARTKAEKPNSKHAKSYTEEYKRALVKKLAKETAADISRKTGVSASQIRKWQKRIKSGQPLYERGKYPKPAGGLPRPYVKAVDKANGVPAADGSYSTVDTTALRRNVQSCIVSLRGVKAKINVADPVHLVAMIVLATLEGKL